MLLWAKQPSPLHPPRPPQKENYFVRKFMVCLFIDCLNLEYGQCSLFLSRLLFSTWGCWKEDQRQHERRDALFSLRPSQVLCYMCLQQKFVKFPLQLWRYRCVTETWLPWRLPYDHQTELITFVRPLTLRQHLYEISRVQRKKIRLFDWLGS